MTPDRREAAYLTQTGRPTLTPRQERRYAKRFRRVVRVAQPAVSAA
jgi:hypothetical protein